MAGKPPPLPAATTESPVDRALSAAIAGDVEEGLRWAVPALGENPKGATALLVMGRLLGGAGQKGAAVVALETGYARALEAGNLGLALASARELEAAGQDAGALLDQLAAAFEKGSSRLAKGAVPPALRPAQREAKPLPANIKGDTLTTMAADAVDQAQRALETDRAGGGAAPFGPQALFSSLGKAALRGILDAFEVELVAAGQRLITQGEMGSDAYVIARGTLEVERDRGDGAAPTLLARLGSGALFGEMSLLSRSPRAAHVTARRPSVVLVAHKSSLDQIAERQPAVASEFAEHCRRRMIENLVKHSPILGAVDAAERPKLIERFVARSFEAGELLISQGQESDGLHLVASGEVTVVHREGDESTVIAKIGVGEVVGEVALVLRRLATADVVAGMPTVTLHLPATRFLEVIKSHPALLAQLYERAILRSEETSRLVAADATEVDDVVLV